MSCVHAVEPVLYLHTTDNSVNQKSALMTLLRRDSTSLEAFDVVSVFNLSQLPQILVQFLGAIISFTLRSVH